MKNIHILPTDKPSKKGDVVIWNGLKIWDGIGKPPHHNQNIYITSNEEIKEGDYVTNGKYVSQAINEWWTNFYIGNPELKADYWKIILTTDEDLIKDGVQSIPDKFLEWFVKNPSCEEVKISPYHVVPSYLMGNEKPVIGYKIIIPKEEPKRDLRKYPLIPNECYKQETLEEAAEKRYPFEDGFQVMDIDISEMLQLAFINGAKWQQERMYSEEDLKNAYFSAIKSTGEGWNGEYAGSNSPNIEDNFSKGFDEWFEQFKKK